MFLSKRSFITAFLNIMAAACLATMFLQHAIAVAGTPDQAAAPQIELTQIELLHKVVDVLAQPDLTSQAFAKEIGGALIKTESAHSWEIAVSTSGVRILTDVSGESAVVKAVRIYFDLEGGLVFRDLAREFGAYRVIHESKTSSVCFDQVSSSRVQIYADLFFSKVEFASPVLSVRIRLE